MYINKSESIKILEIDVNNYIILCPYGGKNGIGQIYKSYFPEQVLIHQIDFDYVKGALPNNVLLYNHKMSLIGTSKYGGKYGFGNIWEYNDTGLKSLMDFSFINGFNASSIIELDIHSFVISCANGGLYKYGNISLYNITIDKYSILIEFNGSNGKYPTYLCYIPYVKKLVGLTQQGGMYDQGTIFSCDTSGSHFHIHHHFKGNSGSTPITQFVSDSKICLYGATEKGGVHGDGVIYKYDMLNDQYTVLFNLWTASGYNPSSINISTDHNSVSFLYYDKFKKNNVFGHYYLMSNVFEYQILEEDYYGNHVSFSYNNLTSIMNEHKILYFDSINRNILSTWNQPNFRTGGIFPYLTITKNQYPNNNLSGFMGLTDGGGINNGTLFIYDNDSMEIKVDTCLSKKIHPYLNKFTFDQNENRCYYLEIDRTCNQFKLNYIDIYSADIIPVHLFAINFSHPWLDYCIIMKMNHMFIYFIDSAGLNVLDISMNNSNHSKHSILYTTDKFPSNLLDSINFDDYFDYEKLQFYHESLFTNYINKHNTSINHMLAEESNHVVSIKHIASSSSYVIYLLTIKTNNIEAFKFIKYNTDHSTYEILFEYSSSIKHLPIQRQYFVNNNLLYIVIYQSGYYLYSIELDNSSIIAELSFPENTVNYSLGRPVSLFIDNNTYIYIVSYNGGPSHCGCIYKICMQTHRLELIYTFIGIIGDEQ